MADYRYSATVARKAFQIAGFQIHTYLAQTHDESQFLDAIIDITFIGMEQEVLVLYQLISL